MHNALCRLKSVFDEYIRFLCVPADSIQICKSVVKAQYKKRGILKCKFYSLRFESVPHDYFIQFLSKNIKRFLVKSKEL